MHKATHTMKENDEEHLLSSDVSRKSYDSINGKDTNGDVGMNGTSLIEKKKKPKRSIPLKDFIVVTTVVLIGDTARGVMFPTLWPYLLSFNADRSILGIAVASFSFGRVISSPIFGWFCTRLGYKLVLIPANLLLMLGTILYACTSSWHLLIVAQIVMGLGSGTLGVTRAFVADNSSPEDRTVYLAYLTATQYAGFTCMPFVGGLLFDIFRDKDIRLLPIINYNIDAYTAPAAFMSIMCLVSILLLLTVFTDKKPKRFRKRKKKEAKNGEAQKNADKEIEMSNVSMEEGKSRTDDATPFLRQQSSGEVSTYEPLDYGLIMSGFLLNIITKGSIACYETLGVAMALKFFSLESDVVGYTFSFFGALGVVSLVSFRYLCDRFNDVQLVMYGVALMLVSSILLQIRFEYIFMCSIFFVYSIGYPVGHTAVIGLFSKVVGKRPQGTLLGWFGSAGSLARIFFPLLAGFISNYFGIRYVFFIVSAMQLACLVFMECFKKSFLHEILET